jgi:hypothetical protein
LTQAAMAGRTGRGVSIAVVDSGIHPSHPHVERVAAGIAIDEAGQPGGDVTDRLGHGTAVAAAIHEKAPDAVLVAVKVFDRSLATSGRALVEAIRWAAVSRISIVNLSLGTTNADHEGALAEAVALAVEAGALVVAAAPDAVSRWLPGALPGVIGVEVDAASPRDACRIERLPDGRLIARASAHPRPIPGIPPERNLQGVSFAVANTTGLLALAIEGRRSAPIEGLFPTYK